MSAPADIVTPTERSGHPPELCQFQPMQGCSVVKVDNRVLLFGQPPEVLKSLIKKGNGRLDSVILPDCRERCGVLLNNLEFPLYYFLFVDNGLAEGRRLRLIGNADHVHQVLEHLRLTLLGPTRRELEAWGTERDIRDQWLNAIEFFALKSADGSIRPVEDFFEITFFENDVAETGDFSVRRLAKDIFEVSAPQGQAKVDLNGTERIDPPYLVNGDYIPNGLTQFGVEVLGGASGFSPEEASTGLVISFNGHYVLIDAIPFLDQHLRARGIAKKQISAVFLTHLHDDHCSLFPLMLNAHRADVITTREIFHMAMHKLSMGLGWKTEVISEHFNLVEIRPGQTIDYYGLQIKAHCTVHSIPTIGGTFYATHQGKVHEICVVGDNQSFTEIREMVELGLIPAETEETLKRLYSRECDLLIADGGMGLIHGDPADALESQADRVVFVHVDRLPERFNATFSLASSGKRYTVLDGNSSLYLTRAMEFLVEIFGQNISPRWLGMLFADMRIRRYNTDDVIIKQGAGTRGVVYLLLTGHCEVIHHDGKGFSVIATREAGELIGEMAVITGQLLRNASVMARTPVTVCEFREETFGRFVEYTGHRQRLLESWSKRPLIGSLPPFRELNSTVVDMICAMATRHKLRDGEELKLAGLWGFLLEGELIDNRTGNIVRTGEELGNAIPFAPAGPSSLSARGDADVLTLPSDRLLKLIPQVPQLNYRLRRYRLAQHDQKAPWLLNSNR
ncbi:MAG: cyclic nucleotide-binding domain-containing protein [Chromatiales bacterium]|nr:cyclic nucleotide-binding domain-containing protein [Chromatiales bacterium]